MTNSKTSTAPHPPRDLRQHLRVQTDLALDYLRSMPGARNRRAVLKQLELLIHLAQVNVALDSGVVTRCRLSPQQRALCIAPVKRLESRVDLDAVRRYVHACLLGADESTLLHLVAATGSAELEQRFLRITRPDTGPRQLQLAALSEPESVSTAA